MKHKRPFERAVVYGERETTVPSRDSLAKAIEVTQEELEKAQTENRRAKLRRKLIELFYRMDIAK